MKEIFFMNTGIAEIVNESFNIICNENMQLVVSDEDASAIREFIDKHYPAASYDVCFDDI